MHGLIDGDVLIYRIGFTTEDVSERLAKFRLRDYLETITSDLILKDYTTYLTSSDKSNFRFKIDPTYKANRTKPKPKHYDMLREEAAGNNLFQSKMVYGKEADDAIGIHATSFPTKKDFCILSIDKDLMQIPGWHYNFVKGKKFYVSTMASSRYLYKQLLMGDSADNINGIIGIGDSIASSLIDTLDTEHDMYVVVSRIYLLTNTPKEELIKRGRLLKIQTKENEPLWVPPELSDEEIKDRAERLIKVDWKKSFDKFSKIREKRLSTNQSECILSTPPQSDSTNPTG